VQNKSGTAISLAQIAYHGKSNLTKKEEKVTKRRKKSIEII
jgi:hypothetical protein